MPILTVTRQEYAGRVGFERLFTAPDFKQCLCWDDDARVMWNENPFTWDEICLVLELLNGGGDPEDVYDQWDEKKKKRFVTLYCKIKSQNADTYIEIPPITKEVVKTKSITFKELNEVIEAAKPLVELITRD